MPWNNSDPGYEGPQDVGPPAFEKNFEDRMKDLIDRYHPDLYYTDGGPPFKQAGYNVVAHLYNENQKWNNGTYGVMETQADTRFKQVPLATAVVPAKVAAGGPPTQNDPIDALIDGKVVKGFGPIFANGVENGMYKLDLASPHSLAQVNTFSSGGKNRAKQDLSR